MNTRESHPSPQELLQALDGELGAARAAEVRLHLDSCWSCRTRSHEFERAIAAFVRIHEGAPIPLSEGPRALLRARLEETPAAPRMELMRRGALPAAAALAVALSLAAWFSVGESPAVAIPNPSLTPGAALLVSRGEVCRESGAKNKEVPASLRQRVFEAYGISRPRPSAYEVDYLITPALGGADDIHNLWPQSYTHTAWNAEVKDALEDHLRELVCAGQVDLATAQHELAVNWIEAYKKYFHTDKPLDSARP